MLPLYTRNAPKRPTNVSLNSDLLRRARELNINLSSTLESSLEQIVKQKLGEQWLAENRSAISSYNDLVDAHGVFSDGLRSF